MADYMMAYSNALKLHASGLGNLRISRELNIPLGTVNHWLYHHVIPNRKFVPWAKGLAKETDERVRRLAKGNEGRIPWNKGKHWSDESKMKMSLAKIGKKQSHETIAKRILSLRGIERTDEWKKNVSEANKGQVPWNKGKTGVYSADHLSFLSQLHSGNKYNLGRVVPLGSRQKISESLLGHGVSLETRQKILGKRLLQVFPIKDTGIEVAVQHELLKRRIPFKKHIPLCGCQPDIVLPQFRKVVRIQGDYWHNRPDVAEKDRRQRKILEENNWDVVDLWEHEINQDVEKAVAQVFQGK